jgi:integrase
MIKARTLLYLSKTLSNGEHPIMICLTRKGQRKYLSTGLTCRSDQWDSKKNAPTRKHPLYRELEIHLSEKINQINKLLLQAESDGHELTLDALMTLLKQEELQSRMLSEHIQHMISRLKTSGRIETANILHATLKAWCKFFKRDHFSLEDINYNTLKQFEDFCAANGNMPNTIFLYLRTLKTAINNGVKEGVIADRHQPFKDFSMAKYRRVKTQKRAIDREELKAIENMEPEKSSSQYHSRNYFLFSFYTGGMNFIDMASLKWENIRNNQISYTRRKTNELINVPLLEPARKLLELYQPLTGESKNSYVFPILNELHNTPNSISNRLNKMNHIVNRDLKEIGEALGIETKLTTYVARHSFATVMKRNGVPVSIIGQALGHEDEKTTQIYLDSFNMDIMEQAFTKLL